MKKTIILILTLTAIIGITGCSKQAVDPLPTTSAEPLDAIYLDSTKSTAERVSDLLGRMTLEEKAAQMVQGERNAVTSKDLKTYGLGSVLSGGGSVPGEGAIKDWKKMMDSYQEAILLRDLKIPMLYGIDSVHGHSNVKGAVIFPHNIGLGAANDSVLVKEMAKIVAEEMKLTKIIWNFSPCVAIASDPRWGRTYESFSTDTKIVTELGDAYFEGLKESGVIATAKHYVADGGVSFGTGSGGNLIDRGDARMSEEKLREIYLEPYKELVKNGVPVVMASFSSFNGEPMHSHKYLLTDVLKNELGFQGFVVSDWEAIHLLDQGTDFNDQVQLSINAGVDMLMEPNEWLSAIEAIVSNVENGKIPMSRIDDAVSRILTVKFESGLFEDPYLTDSETKVVDLGDAKSREVASELVSKSLVLLKNEDEILPFKKGETILVLGPGANNMGIQCGGWTIYWQGSPDIAGYPLTTGTTILEGLQSLGEKQGITFITDVNQASKADKILLVLSEVPYAEMNGDTADMSITGSLASPENKAALELANAQNKPIATLIIAGREVIIDDYVNQWDGLVMGFLPGSEGQGVADVLLGEKAFVGKLPMPWYKSVEDIGNEQAELMYPIGYGLNYAND
ncbi:glycoside hydrolase family 3 protein [Fusibacter bizertensis]